MFKEVYHGEMQILVRSNQTSARNGAQILEVMKSQSQCGAGAFYQLHEFAASHHAIPEVMKSQLQGATDRLPIA